MPKTLTVKEFRDAFRNAKNQAEAIHIMAHQLKSFGYEVNLDELFALPR